ncbi:hypothetical protein GCM10028796_46830 [Ramlibacter monticola]|uniref:Zinc ribbon domain-containing protein n=1 Tax=Ramlibacter monticola TaxID=1926872 RepID=A0A937CW02_9BURK|nr:zinc ribbon domain-containing protein [Ramlibacter monticola]MBL0394308.1 zinc ribbon domain-containing protein [Ramlibacter monticola]
MPTYTFRCDSCERVQELVMPISRYCSEPPRPQCCERAMQRVFLAAPGLGVISEAHYEGLRASDGTDISSRAKHRAYMREHNLTTIDDFTETWKRAARQRALRMQGIDVERPRDIAQAIDKLGGEDVAPREGS